MTIEQYLTSIVTPLCSKPAGISVKTVTDDKGTVMRLSVDKSDMAIIIGKQGETAHAIRALLRRFGSKNKSFASLVILEPEN